MPCSQGGEMMKLALLGPQAGFKSRSCLNPIALRLAVAWKLRTRSKPTFHPGPESIQFHCTFGSSVNEPLLPSALGNSFEHTVQQTAFACAETALTH